MSTYLMRLDDAAEHMNIESWSRMERLLDSYSIKPIVGVIPNNKDEQLCSYPCDNAFWERVVAWREKGWSIAMHGYDHVYVTRQGGINPVQQRSEFAGLSLNEQRRKIKDGITTFSSHGILPTVFFAPSHTFDEQTLSALLSESSIRIVSDTVAIDSYEENGLFFVPVQSGRVRALPFRVVTFCYHPNTMNDADFVALETFLSRHANKFGVCEAVVKQRHRGFADKCASSCYFALRKMRGALRGRR